MGVEGEKAVHPVRENKREGRTGPTGAIWTASEDESRAYPSQVDEM